MGTSTAGSFSWESTAEKILGIKAGKPTLPGGTNWDWCKRASYQLYHQPVGKGHPWLCQNQPEFPP